MEITKIFEFNIVVQSYEVVIGMTMPHTSDTVSTDVMGLSRLIVILLL